MLGPSTLKEEVGTRLAFTTLSMSLRKRRRDIHLQWDSMQNCQQCGKFYMGQECWEFEIQFMHMEEEGSPKQHVIQGGHTLGSL